MATAAEALTLAFDLQAAGRRGEARELLNRILAVAADLPDAQHLTGLLDSADGDHAAADARLRRAAALAPGRADIAQNHARALSAANAAASAQIAALRIAARSAPVDPEWPARLAQTALADNRYEQAAAAARRLLAFQPDFAEGWRIAGEAAHALGRFAEAADALLRRALLRRKEAAAGAGSGGAGSAVAAGAGSIWVAAGAAARAADRQPAAIAAFQTALALQPDRLDALATLANALRDEGRIAAAVAAGDRALRLSGGDPTLGQTLDPTLGWNQALILLTAGRLAEGWPLLENRWRAKGFPTPPRARNTPLWRGEDLRGRSILLYEEQGRGDAIQFVRYAPLLAARGASVIVEVGADLVALFRCSLAGAATVIAVGDPVAPTDFVCPLMSLPLGFGSTLDDIPAAGPYLRADPAKSDAWRRRLGDDKFGGGGFKVGVVWAGNPAFADDRRRSPGVEPLAPLFAVPGVRWFGLRTGPAPYPHFTDLGPDIADFSDTAAIMANMDLIVSSCTAAAHLAGGLGRPTWVLLAKAADWRWLTDRDDSPWHPTARLFRQERAGDWAGVAERAAAALRQEVASGR